MRLRRFLCLIAGLPGVAAPAAPPGAEALVLITADQHSAYERAAQLVATVDRLKTENPTLPLAILVDGDTMEFGNVVARRSAGAIDFALFSALAERAPLVINVGNHEPEFLDLPETIRRLQATGAVVISNISDQATGRPFTAASTRLQLGREEAVIVGVATDHRATYRAAVRPSLDLAEPAGWARQHFPSLLARAPLPIVLSHAGLAADRAMLPLVPDGTLFAGAHDHLRFVLPRGRGAYVHSGSWNEFLTLAWLCRDAAGPARWVVEQQSVPIDGPADGPLRKIIRETEAKFLTPADTAVVGQSLAALAPAEAARFVAHALREAAGADAALIGNTTFGAGLPAGAVTQVELDACVRFDGGVCVAEVTGARLQQLLAAANQGPDTPFAQRRGEFCHADGPADVDPGKVYRIATTDWGARNTANYFGDPPIAWTELPGLKLKAAVLAALKR